MVSSSTILDEIVAVWGATRAKYRDGLLKVGGLVSDYLIAKAIESDGCNQKQAKRYGLLRYEAINEVSQKLGVNRNRVYCLTAATKVVELLSNGVNLGTTPYSVIVAFKGLVKRRNSRVNSSKWVSGQDMQEYRRDRECWVIKNTKNIDAVALFRRAVEEQWKTEDIRVAINKIIPKGRGGRPYESPPDLVASIKVASPKEAAELLLDLILSTSSPEEVESHLLSCLKRKAMMFV